MLQNIVFGLGSSGNYVPIVSNAVNFFIQHNRWPPAPQNSFNFNVKTTFGQSKVILGGRRRFLTGDLEDGVILDIMDRPDM